MKIFVGKNDAGQHCIRFERESGKFFMLVGKGLENDRGLEGLKLNDNDLTVLREHVKKGFFDTELTDTK